MGCKAGLTLEEIEPNDPPCTAPSSSKPRTADTRDSWRVGPAAMTDNSPRRLMLEELLALRIRFNASLASPICASTQAEEAIARKMDGEHLQVDIVIQCSTDARAFAQSPLWRWSMLGGETRPETDGERMLRRLGDSDRLRFVWPPRRILRTRRGS